LAVENWVIIIIIIIIIIFLGGDLQGERSSSWEAQFSDFMMGS
jgi:hypothetical protein